MSPGFPARKQKVNTSPRDPVLDDPPHFTHAHLAYLLAAFPLPELEDLVKMTAADQQAQIGQNRVLKHIKALIEER